MSHYCVLLNSLQPLGMHVATAVWLAVMPRKAEKTISLSTERSWINVLIGCWLIKSIWGVTDCNNATAVIDRTLASVLLFTIMLKTLSQMATTLILSRECCLFSYSYWLMNACNLTSGLALEKGTVWLPKISEINPLRSSFIISSSIHTASRRITGWMNTGNTEPHCDFQSSNSWRGVTWAELYLILHRERSKMKFELPCCSERTFVITKVENRAKKKRLLFLLF